MRNLFIFFTTLLNFALIAQNPGDTITVSTFNYTQTSGSGIRDTMIDFPDNPNLSFEKIIMLYNMRCKDGLISGPGHTNLGCGEWDYSCNTYITDSSKVDSVLSFTSSHTISAFTGNLFEYVETPIYDYFQYRQKSVEVNNINNENLNIVGTGNLWLNQSVSTANNSGKSQYLYSNNELTAAGITSGNIDALLLDVIDGSSNAEYFMVKLKNTNKTSLNPNDPDIDNFTEVYFHDFSFSPGENRIQFHTPFPYDGVSNLIIEFSFTNNITSNEISIVGFDSGTSDGIYSNNCFSLNSVVGKILVPTDPMSSISEEITISFWSNGNEDIQPIHNSIIHGVDENNNRQLNVHLPWGNSNIYFDCGNDGSTYDRINKVASPDEFKGNWTHWTFIKNTTTGEMKIYKNGGLWLTGDSKTRLIDIKELILATSGTSDRSYFGKIDEFRIWNTELSQQTIENWMFKKLDNTHPNYNNLVAYYPIDEGEGTNLSDLSPFGENATIIDYLYWVFERGNEITRGFESTTEKPNLTFAQGSYNLTVNETIVTDSVIITPNIVSEFEIIPRYGTMMHDSINQLSINEYWQSQYSIVYDPEGIAIDSTFIAPTNSIEVTSLQYYSRYPAKFEIMSFVTPYGIYLDLGMEGKTWAFDVTDYTPVLSGTKRMTIERGGQRQEDMDIKFLFIVGTPPHDVLDINQIWRPDSKGYSSILNNTSFEPRNFYFNPDGDMFKFRSVITGHGQEGEFIGRFHNLNIDEGDIEYEWRVWTECSEIAIYPQGGTWIYDRAGWCPGTPSDLYEYDITQYVIPGQYHILDYGLETATGTSNYIVNNQLVTYGEPNFQLDATVVTVLKPNSNEASQLRFNPACSYPEIVIQNTGSTPITEVEISYFVDGGETNNYIWEGSLNFLEKDTVILPVDDISFWVSGSNNFTAVINTVNGQTDEYLFNNSYTSHFDDIHVYPDDSYYTIQLKTNNYGYQSSYTLKDGDGNQLFERDNCDNNTLYEDEFYLTPGCYQLTIHDLGDNGLDFWHQPNQGTGYFRIKDADGSTLYTFDPDFGGFATFEFGIGNITKIDDKFSQFSLNIYPNPTSSILNIEVNNTSIGEITAVLTSSSSVTVRSKQWKVKGDTFTTNIDISDLPSSVYILTLQYNELIKTVRVIKY